MNLILLNQDDYIADDIVHICDYRHKYVRDIHQPQVGGTLTVGDLSGCIGHGVVLSLTQTRLVMQVTCTQPPPEPLPMTLVLALPRPKVFKRILLSSTTLGIKRIIVCNSWRVDKSYWGSPALSAEEIDKQLITGLEQAKDTVLPTVELRNRFKPFVEDELPQIVAESCAYVAHPVANNECPAELLKHASVDGKHHITVAIGPEGGFIPYEVDALQRVGFQPVKMGARILRVETAVSWIAGHI